MGAVCFEVPCGCCRQPGRLESRPGSLLPSRRSGLQLHVFTSSKPVLLSWHLQTWCPSDKPWPVSVPATEVRVAAPQAPSFSFLLTPPFPSVPLVLGRPMLPAQTVSLREPQVRFLSHLGGPIKWAGPPRVSVSMGLACSSPKLLGLGPHFENYCPSVLFLGSCYLYTELAALYIKFSVLVWFLFLL